MAEPNASPCDIQRGSEERSPALLPPPPSVDGSVIAPSILAADFCDLRSECTKVIDAGADWLHVDVMDGHFVPNISLGVPIVKSMRRAFPSAFLDIHLMIENPGSWFDAFARVGGSQLTFHWEALLPPSSSSRSSFGSQDAHNDKQQLQSSSDSAKAARSAIEFAQIIRTKHQIHAGLSVKPLTPVEDVFEALDSGLFTTLLVMTVEPGFGGQAFLRDVMPKVAKARDRYPQLIIQVDGGLTLETTDTASAYGANAIVAGTSIFGADDVTACITQMRESVRKRRQQSRDEKRLARSEVSSS